MISKVIFDTRNPFKLPRKTFGRTGRTYLLTYAHTLISKPHSVPPYTPYTTELVVAGSNLRTSLRSFVNYGTGRSGSKAYRNDQLWKTSVESHLVRFCFHTYMHAYILVLMCCKCCRCRKSHATHEMSCHNGRCQMFKGNVSWRQAPPILG